MNILTLDIGGTSIKYGVFNDDCLLFHRECPSQASSGKEQLLHNVYSIIDSIVNENLDKKGIYDLNSLQGEGALQANSSLSSENSLLCKSSSPRKWIIDAIGISTAGQVDTKQGKIVYANDSIPDYIGTPIKELLEEKYHLPVYVENDVNAHAIGESMYGAGTSYPDFLCLTYGTGVGGAIIIDHKLYKGINGVAAEMGHMVTHPNGLACGCGSHGCYEQYASTTALVRRALTINPNYQNGKRIFDALATNDANVKELVTSWIEEISYGLINLIYIFNPSCIVIGGGIMAQPYIIEELRKVVYAHTEPSFHSVQLLPAKLGNLAGLYGMMSIASKRY